MSKAAPNRIYKVGELANFICTDGPENPDLRVVSCPMKRPFSFAGVLFTVGGK